MHIYTYIYIYMYIHIPFYSHIMGYHRISPHTSSYIIIHHCRITAMVGLTNTIIIQSLLVKPMAGFFQESFQRRLDLELGFLSLDRAALPRQPTCAPQRACGLSKGRDMFWGERGWPRRSSIFFFSGIMGR